MGCSDEVREFEFSSTLDADLWYERCSKVLMIKENKFDNVASAKSVFSNTNCNIYLLEKNEWVDVGVRELNVLVDKEGDNIPDVTAVITGGDKPYNFLVCPRPAICSQGNKTCVIPKALDMDAEFKEEIIAFEFSTESDAQMFKDVFW